MTVRAAVVLAAGEGTRLRPLTRNRPKPMLPAADRPILEHVFDALIGAGIERLHVVVGYKRDRVQDHFGPTYRNIPINYIPQHKQLGSGHALLQARSAVAGEDGLLVVNGDQVVEQQIVADVLDAFESGEASAALAATEGSDVSHYGAVVMDGDRVTELVEKPGTDNYRLLNAGVYAFDQSIFDAIEQTPRVQGELALTDTLVRLIDSDEVVQGVITEGLWVDATYPWDLLDVAQDLLFHGRVTEPERGDSVWVADTAQVHEDATLQGPVVVGPDCDVRPGAVVGPYTAVGRNATVGANAVVERSVLDTDTRVGPNSTLLDCVTGQGVHLGAGATVADGPGDVRVEDEVFVDQRLGAVLADRVRAEGDVSFAPGTLVGPNARLHTGVTVSKNVKEGAEVLR
ncbi:bifunctional sugar-1-phosphate nucleotidylyltransferase/acetyltransferase [Halorussus halophilus]|uniref:bifunctional sugar-1-phosphate nucleotidylyltransferase/acetyltransferase n=1 Tax=Halorussus halophilus TaxID=2650975 RepID=UPI0013016F5A|nr:bifunctional sugar-1-phosphate nucleotidylyltransferase/acetyltransferase [Halorussus halophilus]